jgi:anti-sigma B factor antagonist
MDLWITDGPLDGATHVVEPHGDIDFDTAPKLKATLDAAIDTGARYVLVDFGDVGFVDSSGIGVLISAQGKLRLRDGKVLVICSHPQIRRVFEMTGLTALADTTPACREALLATQQFAAAN